jgi:hypothetical protein
LVINLEANVRLLNRAVTYLAVVMVGTLSVGAAENVHQHGHGTLGVVIEGQSLFLELEAPGSDLLGFEHEASTKSEQLILKETYYLLSDPISLFGIPASAECSLVDAAVGTGDDHDELDGDSDVTEHSDESSDETHNEIHAKYDLHCISPTNLDRLSLAYFEMFPSAEELDVAIISPAGQITVELTAEEPNIVLQFER